MKIEIVKAPDRFGERISFDGEIDNDFDFSSSNKSIYIEKEGKLDKFFGLTIKQLRDKFNYIDSPLKQNHTEWSTKIEIYLNKKFNFNIPLPLIVFQIEINGKSWTKHYSIRTVEEIYKNEIKENFKLEYIRAEENELFMDNEIGGFAIPITNEEQLFEDTLSNIIELYGKISEKVEEKLREIDFPDILTTVFEFPEELKTSCKQYLIYFAQFLSDIGINAGTAIKDEANKVLFTIIPEDENVALDRIKEALEIYMNAPGNPEVEIISDEPKDIAVLQWEANVFHLKSQIALQQAVLQMKDATIESLQLSNYMLKEEITTAKQIEEKASGLKEEKFMGGTVAVKKYDGKWFSVDLPSLIRRLKRKK